MTSEEVDPQLLGMGWVDSGRGKRWKGRINEDMRTPACTKLFTVSIVSGTLSCLHVRTYQIVYYICSLLYVN